MGKSENGTSGKPPETVDEALDRFWIVESIQGQIPDYVGFMSWIYNKEKAIRAVARLPIHAEVGPEPLLQLAIQLLNAAKAAGIEIAAERAFPDPDRFGNPDGKNLELKSLNRGKLLLHYFSEVSPRRREMFAMMAKAASSTLSVTPRSSQLEHREAFFRAVASGDGHLAFKMVGRLRDEEHDLGELAFLEATASFHSNRFDEAIQHAREVPQNAIDWPRAFMLKLESQAYKGDIEAVSESIQSAPGFLYPDFFILYVCQVAVDNNPFPEEAFERVKTIIVEKTRPSTPGSGVYLMWNRYSCQLAVQSIELQRELALRELAVEQTGSERTEIQLDRDLPLRVRQIAYALALDSDLVFKLMRTTLDEAYQKIVKRLINYSPPKRTDYFQALIAQWRVGDRSVFLTNVITNLNMLTADSTPDAWQLVIWAYQEAQILGRSSDCGLLKTKILESPTMAKKLAEVESAVSNDRLDRQLSPMGQLALRSATWDLKSAENESSLWKDAGMISLGFFRILELEFNERLIFPMLELLHMESLNSDFSALKANELRGIVKKAVDFWDKMIRQINRARLEQKGLELGAIELLLRKLADPEGVDASLKSRFRSVLLPRLSSTGIEAFESGELASLIDESQREKFRNPPAHTRYVDLETAQECKAHVHQALQRLIAYTTRNHPGVSMIH
jgi:hypothetical protein